MPRWMGHLVALGVSVSIGLLLSEGLIRFFAPQPLVQLRPEIWMPVDGLGHTTVPGVNTTVNTGEGPVRFLTDERGHRIGAAGPPKGKRKILAVGDSFLEALQVDYEEIVTAQLDAMLAHRAPKEQAGSETREYAVITAGVSGWDPRRYYIKVRDELEADQYDFVLVFVFVGNDVVSDTTTWFPARPKSLRPMRWPERLQYRELVDAWVYPIYQELRTRSHLVVFLKRRFLNLWLRLGLSKRSFSSIYLKSQSDSPDWDMTVHLLEKTAEEASRAGARSMVVLIPPDFVVDKEMGYKYAAGSGVDTAMIDLDQPTRLLGQKLRERAIVVLDMTQHFEALLANGVQVYGKVDRHLNTRGHQEMAKVIAHAISCTVNWIKASTIACSM